MEGVLVEWRAFEIDALMIRWKNCSDSRWITKSIELDSTECRIIWKDEENMTDYLD